MAYDVSDYIEFTNSSPGSAARLAFTGDEGDLYLKAQEAIELRVDAVGSVSGASFDFRPGSTSVATLDATSFAVERLRLDPNSGLGAQITAPPGQSLLLQAGSDLELRANRRVSLELLGRSRDGVIAVDQDGTRRLAVTQDAGGTTFSGQVVLDTDVLLDCSAEGFQMPYQSGAPSGAGDAGRLVLQTSSGGALHIYIGTSWRSLS